MNEKEIKALLKKLPKEHRKEVKVAIESAYKMGVKRVQELIHDISTIPAEEIELIGVYNSDDLAGG